MLRSAGEEYTSGQVLCEKLGGVEAGDMEKYITVKGSGISDRIPAQERIPAVRICGSSGWCRY